MNTRKPMLPLVLLIAALVACNSEQSTPPNTARLVDKQTEPQTLAGQRWNLVTINGAAPAAEAFIVFDQTASQYRGSTGCNQISGTVSGIVGALEFGAVRATKRMCLEPPGVDEQEQALFLCLNALQASSFEADVLVLEADGQRLEFKPAQG